MRKKRGVDRRFQGRFCRCGLEKWTSFQQGREGREGIQKRGHGKSTKVSVSQKTETLNSPSNHTPVKTVKPKEI